MASVLIVDDEAAIRAVVRRWLEPEGYVLGEADTAETALEVLAGQSYDVILSDVQMPGHDGLWLIARVRERYPHSAIVLATSVDSVAPVISMQNGVIQYLVKPLQRGRLLAAVRAAAEWHAEAAVQPARPKAQADPIAEWMKAGPYGRRAGRPPEE
jgi:DNA-binding NtrC family response regulator